MAYTPQTWANLSAGGTALSAARLTVMENGIRDAHITADANTTNVATALANATTALSTANAADLKADQALAASGGISETIVNTKGDLIVATGADAVGILPSAGADRILTVDASTATGLKWGRKITVGTFTPGSPQVGDLWLDPNAAGSGGSGGTTIDQFGFYPTIVPYATGPGAEVSTGVPDTDATAFVQSGKPTWVAISDDPLKGKLTVRLIDKDAMDNWKWSE